ncbi:MAG: hypothetical protein ABWZ57_03725 [Mesorhizobium sp.]
MNRSVARPPSVSGVEQAMTPGLIGSLVEELKSGSGAYTLQEFYTIFRDSLAAAKKGNVEQVLGELRVSIEPLRRPVQESVCRFGAFPAAHQIDSFLDSLDQWHRQREEIPNMGSVTIENLRIGMDRLEGLLNEFAPSATMKSTIRPNENTASRSYGGFAPVDPPTLHGAPGLSHSADATGPAAAAANGHGHSSRPYGEPSECAGRLVFQPEITFAWRRPRIESAVRRATPPQPFALGSTVPACPAAAATLVSRRARTRACVSKGRRPMSPTRS